MFLNGYERSDVIEDCRQFLTVIKKMESYLVEFKEDGIIKDKNYSLDCIVRGEDYCPVIVITHDKCIFSVNDSI